MGDGAPRALLLGMLRLERKLDPGAIATLADGARFAPAPLTAEERARLENADLAGGPPWVAGDYPEWLDPYLARVFGEERSAEGAALASRAPLDLRVNMIKARARRRPQRWRKRSRADAGRRWACVALAADAKAPAIRRARLHQGHGRGAGRGLAARRAACRQAGRAGDRPLRRCGRQDARARRDDGESRAALRHRHRQAPACAHPRAPRPLRRAQRAGAYPALGGRCARRPRRPRRPGADRRALHRHRHLAAQSDAKWRVRPGALARRRSRRRCSTAPPPW